MTKMFKGLPICEEHGITYRYQDGCCRICKKNKKPMKKLDRVLKEMEEKGLIPKTKEKIMCHYCQTREASEGDSYKFKPICHICCHSKSLRYRKEYDKNNDNNI